jgi:tRNA(Ile)-lysidine synthase
MLGKGDRSGSAARLVLVGVSGGADSVGLVNALVRLGIRVGVAHFDHRWRGTESREDRDFVRRLADDLGLPFHEGHSAVDSPAKDEAGARRERLRFFHQTARGEGYRRIALAHTRSDRAETLLLNLVRGAGVDGLVSIRPVTGIRIRPLIDLTRFEVERYLSDLGQQWREDATNRDVRFARNRVRHQVFPALRELNPRLEDALARTIEILQDENAWMETVAEDWLSENLREENGDFVLAVGDLAGRHPALIRRVLRSAIDRAHRLAPEPPTSDSSPGETTRLDSVGLDHVDAVRSLLGPGKSGRTIEIPGPVNVERSFESLRFFRAGATPAIYNRELGIPGRVEIPEIGRRFEARICSTAEATTPKPNPDRVFVDGESLGPYVRIRNWQKGDLYNPAGMKASTLKSLFQRNRVPWRQRLEWPVVVARSSIVWVASFPVSRDFAVTARSRKTVELVVSRL